jgi:hypothetical protein
MLYLPQIFLSLQAAVELQLSQVRVLADFCTIQHITLD